MACRLCFYIFEENGTDNIASSSSNYVSSDYVLAISTIPELDLELSADVLICHTCVQTLNVFRDFKETCQRTENIIAKYKKHTKGRMLNLTDLVNFYINIDAILKDAIVCCTCLQCPKSSEYQGLLDDPLLVKFLSSCIDVKMILSTPNPMLCENCITIIEELCDFKEMCETTQKSIQSYYQATNKVLTKEDLIYIAKKRGVKLQTSKTQNIKQEEQIEIKKEPESDEEANKEEIMNKEVKKEIENYEKDTEIERTVKKDVNVTLEEIENQIKVKEEIEDIDVEDTVLQCTEAEINGENAIYTIENPDYANNIQCDRNLSVSDNTIDNTEYIQNNANPVDDVFTEGQDIQESINNTANIIFERLYEETLNQRSESPNSNQNQPLEYITMENNTLELRKNEYSKSAKKKSSAKTDSKSRNNIGRSRPRSKISDLVTHVLSFDGRLYKCRTCNIVSECRDLIKDHIKNKVTVNKSCRTCRGKIRTTLEENTVDKSWKERPSKSCKKKKNSSRGSNRLNNFIFKCSICCYTSKRKYLIKKHIEHEHIGLNGSYSVLVVVNHGDITVETNKQDQTKSNDTSKTKNAAVSSTKSNENISEQIKINNKTPINDVNRPAVSTSTKMQEQAIEPCHSSLQNHSNYSVQGVLDGSQSMENENSDTDTVSSDDDDLNEDIVKKFKSNNDGDLTKERETYKMLDCIVCTEMFDTAEKTKHLLYRFNELNNAALYKCLNCNYIASFE